VQKKHWWLAWLALLACVAVLVWQLRADSTDQPQSPAASGRALAPTGSAAGSAESDTTASGANGPYSAAGMNSRQQLLALWRQRYDDAEQRYTSYRDATRYPHESRPVEEHPDQLRPFDPVSEIKTLRDASGKAVKGLRLRTTQELVFLAGAESVKFTIEAFDDKHKVVPLSVTHSLAQTIPDTSSPITVIQANVPFSDDGTGPDAVAGDGKYTARLSPATQGFANHAGTIRLLAQVAANGEQGVAHFDVVYSPGVPATWLGVREALESGSLNFYLKAQVQVAGRYVVSGRVYDANDKPFALVQFNDEVPAGLREFRLQLFGALVRDINPTFPLKLVDVDGFLLRPDAFPDRSMMARRPGTVHTTGRYGMDRFSAAEWTSEERERYLAEYRRDVQKAEEQVRTLQSP
jgi:hypothetical protein